MTFTPAQPVYTGDMPDQSDPMMRRPVISQSGHEVARDLRPESEREPIDARGHLIVAALRRHWAAYEEVTGTRPDVHLVNLDDFRDLSTVFTAVRYPPSRYKTCVEIDGVAIRFHPDALAIEV
jgi:hypothetical protein